MPKRAATKSKDSRSKDGKSKDAKAKDAKAKAGKTEKVRSAEAGRPAQAVAVADVEAKAKQIDGRKAEKENEKRAGKKARVQASTVGRGEVESAVEPFAQGMALATQLRVPPGFVLADVDPSSTPGYLGTKEEAEAQLAGTATLLEELQERLWASRVGDPRSVLIVLQGMDTSGKGGIVRHVLGSVDPQGVSLHAFKKPTDEERSHDFLWRIRRALPGPGEIGVFDRSHYEDVLAVRVHDLVPRATWSRRYAAINRFEAGLVAKGTPVVKIFLHISYEEQGRRLAARLERPDKYWKYNPGDVDERLLWPAYQDAYQDVLTRCSPDEAPWFVVPADHKWYARWAVQHLLLRTLQGLELKWPLADFDVEGEKARLAAT